MVSIKIYTLLHTIKAGWIFTYVWGGTVLREIYNNSNLNNTDLNVYQCGMEECSPSYSYGPAVRDHYIIHYIRRGKGIFKVGDKIYHLSEGQGFLICPGIVTFYQADPADPWYYYWIGFHGIKAELYLKKANLTMDNPIFKCEKDDYAYRCFAEMVASKVLTKSREIRLIGLLNLFLSQLIEASGDNYFSGSSASTGELYVRKAIEYMERNFSRKIKVSDVSNYIGVDIKYLSALFREYLSTPTQQYLIHLRVEKACGLMKATSLSIGDISRSVGYEDPLQFSKIFKKVKGISPKEYRRKNSGEK